MEADPIPPPRRATGAALPRLVVVQVVIALIALAVMLVVAWEIRPLLEEKQRLETAVADYQTQIQALRREHDQLQAELKEARARLQQTSQMSRFAHPIDLVDTKMLASRYPGAARALRLMLHLRGQNVGWHLGGRTPEQGFDSPSFAAYVLDQLDVDVPGLPSGASLQDRAYRLADSLPPVDEPDIGDLVFYPSGYALFYFRDQRGEPFVIGMTPLGIVALSADFAEVTGYRRSGIAESR